MSLKIFNTLTRTVEPFVPLDSGGKKVGIYCCGPTVHDFAHIGNYRTFLFSDLLRRYLEFKGYEVQHVMNITDVEDKIIKRVRDTKIPRREYTKKYEAAFLEDLQTLNCLRPHAMPHATEHIPEIISLIRKLIDRGMAYQASDGSVYFSIEKYTTSGYRYGQLVKLNFEQMRPGERVSSDEYDKQSLADFALWKARAPEDGDVFWESPWGQGRPGWHIECSAMSMKLLGPGIDLHLGGEDLIFPHHEDEIAQSEGAALQPPGQRFVKYWMHGAHLLVEGKKMSKSLGNFFTLRDLLNKGFTGPEVRYLLLRAHYRETFNFTVTGLEGARSAFQRIDDCLLRVNEVAQGKVGPASPSMLADFEAALDADLNVSAGWAVIFAWIRELNTKLAEGSLSDMDSQAALGTWRRINSVLGLGTTQLLRSEAAQVNILGGTPTMVLGENPPEEIMALLEQRQAARTAKDFKRADALREELRSKGWLIEDTSKGPRLKHL